MKVFFFGGTFDPPHKGHELIVKTILPMCEKLILLPVKHSPGKSNQPLASDKHRLNMLKILFENNKIEIDDFDLKAGNPNYTYLTVTYLKKKYINSEISMIIGYDQFKNLKNWKNCETIFKNVNIICFNRNNKEDSFDNYMFKRKINYIKDFKIDISSTEIRNELSNNNWRMIKDSMNPILVKYIKENNLYV